MDLVGLVLGSSTQRRVNHPACARVLGGHALGGWRCPRAIYLIPRRASGLCGHQRGPEWARGSGRWRTSFEFYVLFIDRVLLHNSDFQKPDLHGIVNLSARVGTGLLGGTTVQILNDQSS